MFRFFRKNKEKITPIDLSNPDAVVTVTNTRLSQNPFGKNYRGCCEIEEDFFTSVCFQTIDDKDMLYNQPHRCYANFLMPAEYPHTLWVGREINLYEGKGLVGTMLIEEIRNKALDREIKYADKEEILSDTNVLNAALKYSLDFGPKMNKPLDIKLMKKLPTLSGGDIDKISKYVIQVRDDILWKIYYPNWDSENQCLKIDAAKVTEETYPWINSENLKHLDSQGKYFAWHG